MNKALLGTFNIDDEIERFRPEDNEAGRRAETLIKTVGLRVVLVTMRTGIALHDHMSPGPLTIQVLRGRFSVTFADDHREVRSGELISLAAGVTHAVRTIEEGAFLLTIGWGATESSDLDRTGSRLSSAPGTSASPR